MSDSDARNALLRVVQRLAAMQKLRNSALLLVAFMAVFFIGKCQGRGEGEDSQADKVLRAEVKQHDKAAKQWKDSAEKALAQIKVYELNLTKADAKVRDVDVRLHAKDVAYRQLRDSVLSAPTSAQDTTLRRVISAADSALAAAKLSAQAKDSALVARDSVIASQKRVIAFQLSAITERESQISALNRRLEISARKVGRARREGFVVGAAVGATALLTVFASK